MNWTYFIWLSSLALGFFRFGVAFLVFFWRIIHCYLDFVQGGFQKLIHQTGHGDSPGLGEVIKFFYEVVSDFRSIQFSLSFIINKTAL